MSFFLFITCYLLLLFHIQISFFLPLLLLLFLFLTKQETIWEKQDQPILEVWNLSFCLSLVIRAATWYQSQWMCSRREAQNTASFSRWPRYRTAGQGSHPGCAFLCLASRWPAENSITLRCYKHEKVKFRLLQCVSLQQEYALSLASPYRNRS